MSRLWACCLLLVSAELSEECQRYLRVKGFAGPNDLYNELLKQQSPLPCVENATAQGLYAPKAAPDVLGAMDTSSLSCRFGNPQMWSHCGTCCGLRPHFNWVLATCDWVDIIGKRTQ